MVDLLLQAGAEIDGGASDGQTPLHHAAFLGVEETVETLLEAGANIEAASTTGARPLHNAAKRGHVNVAKLLLDAGAFIDAVYADGKTTALKLSLATRHSDVVRLLVSRGADTSSLTQKEALVLDSFAPSKDEL